MCYCSFAIGQFLILKNQSERQAIELLFKVQIILDYPSSNTIRVVFYADKKIQMTSEITLLAGTEDYYCFDSKGDNFKVNQL